MNDSTAVLLLLSNEHALKSGTFGVPGLVLLGRGTTRHKSGTGGNPINSCPETKLEGGLQQLHSADVAAEWRHTVYALGSSSNISVVCFADQR